MGMALGHGKRFGERNPPGVSLLGLGPLCRDQSAQLCTVALSDPPGLLRFMLTGSELPVTLPHLLKPNLISFFIIS